MSAEQWGLLALFVLLPLLEWAARFRRAHARKGQATDQVGEVRAPRRGSSLPNRDVDDKVAAKPAVSPPRSLPPPLPQRAPPPAISPSRLAARRTSSRDSASLAAHTRSDNPSDPVVQWLRPVRNLRRAIVVATILGPPRQ